MPFDVEAFTRTARELVEQNVPAQREADDLEPVALVYADDSMTPAQRDALFERIAHAAHEKDEPVFCVGPADELKRA